jgi:hypothetical protein
MATKVLYIAGPMTGIKDYNYPAFNAAAEHLRACGYDVLNPAEVTPPTAGEVKPWRWYMRRALGMVLNCQGIATLPGWPASPGASLEVYVARRLELPVHPVHQWEAWKPAPAELAERAS